MADFKGVKRDLNMCFVKIAETTKAFAIVVTSPPTP